MRITLKYNSKQDNTTVTCDEDYNDSDGGIEVLDFLKDCIGILQAQYTRQKAIDELSLTIQIQEDRVEIITKEIGKLQERWTNLCWDRIHPCAD